MVLNILFGLGLTATLFACAWLGYRVVDITLSKGVYTTKNAVDLLRTENVEAWNAFRRMNAEWRPILRDVDLSGKSLQDVDLRSADLRGANFADANLDGADFTGADARNTIFANASLRHAVFDNATITQSDLSASAISEGILAGVANDATGIRQDDTSSPQSPFSAQTATNVELSQLSDLTPGQFEEYVADVFRKLDYHVELQRGGSDRGVDIILKRDTPLGPIEEIVEVKRVSDQARPISVVALRALQGLLAVYPAQNAVLVTNGQFSRDAVAFANKTNLRLIDGGTLAELASKGNARVSSQGQMTGGGVSSSTPQGYNR